MPPRPTKPPSTESLLPPILSLLQPPSPNPYSAHQKALTTVSRLTASKNHRVAIDILFATSKELFKLGEAGSGCELGVKMCTVMLDGEYGVDDESRARLTQLLALTPPTGPWRKKLADAAVKWSAEMEECPTGDLNLHQYIGELYYKDRQFAQAEIHLLAAGKRDASNVLAEMMFEWSEKGQLDPAPYAIRGVLPFLAQTPPSILPALTFLTRFLALLSASPASSKLFSSTLPSQTSFSLPEIQLTSSPTLNFLQLALITVQRAPAVGVSGVEARGTTGGIGREWEALVGRYKRLGGGGLLADKEVQEILQEISTNVFLIPPPRSGGQGDMLQNLMGSLFGGGGGGSGGGSRLPIDGR
ncbi:golgi to ER traffic protein 4, partial [Tremellales sp. Uapishka_1]